VSLPFRKVNSILFFYSFTKEYFDNMSELRRQNLEDEVGKCEDRLKNVIFLRTNSSTMCDMKEVYRNEDDAVLKNRNQVPYIQGKPIVIEVHQAGEVSEEKVMGEPDTKFHE
jgi:hypothetical protein